MQTQTWGSRCYVYPTTENLLCMYFQKITSFLDIVEKWLHTSLLTLNKLLGGSIFMYIKVLCTQWMLIKTI